MSNNTVFASNDWRVFVYFSEEAYFEKANRIEARFGENESF